MYAIRSYYEDRFHGTFGVRHQTKDVFLSVADSGNGINRTVGVGDGPVCIAVVQQNLVVVVECFEAVWIDVEVAIMMRDGNIDDITRIQLV